MADLWIGNINADASDEEITEFLGRYGFPAFDHIRREPGTGARPAVILSFSGLDENALRLLQPRVHSVFWKDREIVVQVMPPRRIP
jgi:hypothetical protein